MLDRILPRVGTLALIAAVLLVACSPAPAATSSPIPSEITATASPPASPSASADAAAPTTCREAFIAAAASGGPEGDAVPDLIRLCGSVEAIQQAADEFPDVLGAVDIPMWVTDQCEQIPELAGEGICAHGTGGSIPQTELQGEYTSDSPGVSVTFEVTEPGWVGIPELPGAGFGLDRAESEGALFITPFLGEVFSDPCSSTPVETIERSAESFIAFLAAHPELDAAEPVATTLGGHAAVQIDVTADVGEPCPESPRIWLWVLPRPAGDFHVDEGEAARFIAADVGDTTVVLSIETFDPPKQSGLLEASEPILESMVITP